MFVDSHTGKVPATSGNDKGQAQVVEFLGVKRVVYLTNESREAVIEKVFGPSGLLAHTLKLSEFQALKVDVDEEVAAEPQPETNDGKPWDVWSYLQKGMDKAQKEELRDRIRAWASDNGIEMKKNVSSGVREALNAAFPTAEEAEALRTYGDIKEEEEVSED